jgi:alpha-beta hydrolase superfamily lysophospholipase
VLSAHRADEPGAKPAVLLDGGRRDLLVEQIAEALAPAGTRNVLTDWLTERGTDFLLRKATSYGASHREDLMAAATPAAGDVLYYQRRGGEMLDLLTQELAGCQPPVVAVGHSLGGIMLVDLLSRRDHPRVDLLVTAGSQSPMLYAIDALEGIRWGKAETRPFTPWLNIYNRHDFLSFRATRIFNGVSSIRDEEVDPGVPFPESHSAYWYHPKVYELIRAAWPAA